MKQRKLKKLGMETTLELGLEPRKCDKCGVKDAAAHATWCDDCIWDLIKDDQIMPQSC